MSDENDYVGYCNPPRRSQFKKGKSGNPQGRPKGGLNPAMILSKALRETVVIQENGRRKKVTKFEVIAKQMANKAAAGDLKAMQSLMHWFRIFEHQMTEDFASRLAPIQLSFIGVESDGNGNPLPEGAVKRRVKESDPGARPSLWETDSEGKITVLKWNDH